MLANLPHVVAHFVRPGQQQKQGEQMEGPAPLSGLFLLDSGAGGVELMLHARAAQELQVQAAPHVRTHTLKVCALLSSKSRPTVRFVYVSGGEGMFLAHFH